MIFVGIADTHCRHHSLKLPPGDVLLHAGDVSARGMRSEVKDFLGWFGAQPHRYKVLIGGNHDFIFEELSLKQINALLPEGVTYLKDSGITIEGIHIWGSPFTPGYPHWAFIRQRGASIRGHWQMVPPETDILMTHGPALGILDKVINGQRAGDRDLLRCIENIKPQVHLCGHIHEAYGSLQQNGTRFFNCSLLNEYYEPVNKPFVFEVVSGKGKILPSQEVGSGEEGSV